MRTFNDKTYRPLPDKLTIKESKIDGLGLHVKPKVGGLVAGTVVGETHVLVHNRDRAGPKTCEAFPMLAQCSPNASRMLAEC